MNKLTKREKIAMMMLQSHPDLVRTNQELQSEIIQNALDFADYFIDISEDSDD